MKGGPAIREDLAPLNGALLKGNEEGFGLVKRARVFLLVFFILLMSFPIQKSPLDF